MRPLAIPLALATILPLAFAQEGREIRIPTRDGAELEALLYLPEGEGPWPTIVVQTPYGKERSKPETILEEEALARYAFLVVDWRRGASIPRKGGGTGAASSGREQGRDGHDVVEFSAAQPWSTGRIGTWGPSALGGVQFRTAEERPPHLACIVPMVRSLQWTYGSMYPGGVEREEYVEMLGTLYGLERLFREHPTRDRFWEVFDRAKRPDRIAVPALLVAGWFDLHPAEMIDSFRELRDVSDPAVRAEHRLLVGPWEHMKVGAAEQGDLEFPDAAIVKAAVGAWFDRWLRGVETPATAPIRYYVVGSAEWREADSWPPAGVHDQILHLRPGGSLAPEASEEATVAIPSRPDDPSPTTGGNNLSPALAHGPKDQAQVERRGDVAVFTTGPLEEPLTIAGSVRLRLFVSTTARDADLHVRVTDVGEDGRSILVADGARRASLPGDCSRRVPLGDLEVRELLVETTPVAWTFRAGHRLRLVASASNHPRYAVDLDSEGTHTLYLGGETPSRAVLPRAE